MARGFYIGDGPWLLRLCEVSSWSTCFVATSHQRSARGEHEARHGGEREKQPRRTAHTWKALLNRDGQTKRTHALEVGAAHASEKSLA